LAEQQGVSTELLIGLADAMLGKGLIRRQTIGQ
jgi:hypothetical protein